MKVMKKAIKFQVSPREMLDQLRVIWAEVRLGFWIVWPIGVFVAFILAILANILGAIVAIFYAISYVIGLSVASATVVVLIFGTLCWWLGHAVKPHLVEYERHRKEGRVA
jgi:hypothetical protein